MKPFWIVIDTQLAAFWLSVTGLCLLVGCSTSAPVPSPSKPPVIVISIDTLRSDRLPIYGYGHVKTPALEAFARDSMVYEKAFAHTPLTLPSHATMFTGLLPRQHGVRDNAGFILAADHLTLAEQLGREGYATGGVVSSMVLRRSTGIGAGFETYRDQFDAAEGSDVRAYPQKDGALAVDWALSWLDQQVDQPPFLFVHLYEPHTPYTPPEPYRSQYSDEPYDGEIAYVDSLLERFFKGLKARNLYEGSLIVVLSDHGEGLGDHGEAEHGIFLYRESLQIPLIVKLPENKGAGARVDQVVGLTDVAPSVAATLGMDWVPCDGVPVFGQHVSLPNRVLTAESLFAQIHLGWYPQASAINATQQLIRGYEWELFNWQQDPKETQNLYGQQAVSEAMVHAVEAINSDAQTKATISEEEKAMLASLGYTGSFDLGSDALAMKPTDIVALKETLGNAQRSLHAKNFQAVEVMLLPLLQKFPTVMEARVFLGTALVKQAKYEQAEYLLMEGLAQDGRQINLLNLLAEVKLVLEKPREAGELARKSVDLEPLVSGKNLLKIFFGKGLFEDAVYIAQAMHRAGSDWAYVHLVLGRSFVQSDPAAAITHLSQAQEKLSGPDQVDTRLAALVFLAESQSALGRISDAEQTLRSALKLNPEAAQTRILLAQALRKQGKADAAKALFRNTDPADSFAGDNMGLFAYSLAAEDAQAAADAAGNIVRHQPEQAYEVGAQLLASGSDALNLVVADVLVSQDLLPSQAVGHFIRGKTALNQKRLGVAMSALQKALMLFQSMDSAPASIHHQAAFYLGDSLAAARKFQDAANAFQLAVSIDPKPPAAHFGLATLYSQAGQQEVAVAVLNRWLKFFPSAENFEQAAERAALLGLKDAATYFRSQKLVPVENKP